MSINQQPVEKKMTSDGWILSVHSIFYTIQGEGPFCGTPAVFIRLAGCNLQCPSCDTDYTSGRRPMPVDRIVNDAQYAVILGSSSRYMGRPLAVITGGEPFRQNIEVLVASLIASGFYVQVESNGTLSPSPGISWNKDTSTRLGAYLVVSPKAGSVNKYAAAHACCFKYVMGADSVNPRDGLPILALSHPAAPQVARPSVLDRLPIYLQPRDDGDPEKNAANLQACIQSCLMFGHVLQLQVHKIINLP